MTPATRSTAPDKFIRQQIGADSQRLQDVAADLEQQLGVLGVVLGRRIPAVIRPKLQQHWEREREKSPEGLPGALPRGSAGNSGEAEGSSSSLSLFLELLPAPRSGFGKAQAASQRS